MKKYIDAIQRILNPFTRENEPVAGDRGFCVGRVAEKGIDKANRRLTATLSTPSLDRYGEVVLPTAFADSLPRFMDNPKFLAGHNSASPDGSPTSIGRWIDMKINERGLIGTAEFLPTGDELADKWWFRFEHGAQRTFSVGFLAHKWEMREVEIDGEKKKVRHFTRAELLEVSAVELPANADAMLMTFGLPVTGAGQGGDDDAPIGKLSNRQFQAAVHAMGPVIREVLRKELSADPYSGTLFNLVRDIVEVVIDLQLHGGYEKDRYATDAHVHDHDDEADAGALDDDGGDGGDADEARGVDGDELAEALETILAGGNRR